MNFSHFMNFYVFTFVMLKKKQMLIDQDMKMADVVLHDPTLVPIINRFGVHLGLGDQSIREICRKHDLHLQFFITILNAFHDKLYFPKEQLQSFPAKLIIGYLQKAHHYFLDEKIPEIAGLIKEAILEADVNKKKYAVIEKFLLHYRDEFTRHIEREEKKVFPYILKLESAMEQKDAQKGIDELLKEYPIAAYQAEHEDVEEKIFDLKNIIVRHLPTPNNDRLWYQILREIFTLEKELNEHARIEDLILIPKVKTMENALKSKRSE